MSDFLFLLALLCATRHHLLADSVLNAMLVLDAINVLSLDDYK